MKSMIIALACFLVLPVSVANATDPNYTFKDGHDRSVYVTDGDTIQINKTKIRLLDIDAGEIEKGPHGYKCDAELQSGLKARDRLFQLLSPPNVFTVLYGKGSDMYGRRLAYVYSNHKNAGNILVTEGLALPYNPRSGQAKPDHCSAPPAPAPQPNPTPSSAPHPQLHRHR